MCMCVFVCMFVHACDSVSARVSVFQCVSFPVFQCVSVSLCFVWLSMSSNVILCYRFLCEYVYIPCFCWIKWQSALSCRMPTINSTHVGPHGKRWMCVRLPIQCEGVVFQCVSVSHCFVWRSMSSALLLCNRFWCEYLCIPWFCLVKWQRLFVSTNMHNKSHRQNSLNYNNAVTPQPLSCTHSLVPTTVIYNTVVINAQLVHWSKMEKRKGKNILKNKTKQLLHSQQIQDHLHIPPTCPPLPANCTSQSIVHWWRFMWKG